VSFQASTLLPEPCYALLHHGTGKSPAARYVKVASNGELQPAGLLGMSSASWNISQNSKLVFKRLHQPQAGTHA
jgi:hypothetical protein